MSEMQMVGGSGKLRAKFFKDDTTGRDMVEIKIIGDPSTWMGKATPEHIAKFPKDWEAYQAGEKEVDVGGTALTEVPGVDRNLALALKLKGVRNAEELAGLDEAAAKGLGMGMYTLAKTAKLLLAAKRTEALDAVVQEAPRRGRPPKTEQPEAAA